jgi:hypothetical protein
MLIVCRPAGGRLAFLSKKDEKRIHPNAGKKKSETGKIQGVISPVSPIWGGFISFSGNSAFSEGLYAISSL